MTAAPHNLLPVSRAFTGREAELDALAGAVRERRVTWLTGPAGIGKTELARAVGHRVREADAFPGGVFHLSLEGAGAVATLMGDLALALGVDETRPVEAAFEGPPRLVIWDQMDGVLARAPERVRQVIEERLAPADDVHHLIVCRAGAPDGAPENGMVLEGLGPEAAFAAFGNHLPESVSARPEPGDPGLAKALPEFGGNPLAIRLAALWCRPPRWTTVLPEGLDTARRPQAPFEGPLGAALALALVDLDHDAERMLCLLSAFPDGANEATLHATYGDEWEKPASALQTTGLTDAVGGRHTVHPAFRPLAPALMNPRQLEGLWDQAAFHLQQALVEAKAQIQSGRADAPLRFLMSEWENLRAAFNWAVERLGEGSIDEADDARLVLDYGLVLFQLFYRQRMLSEGLAWMEVCIDAADRADLPLQHATVTDYAGLFQVRLGDRQGALDSFEAALGEYRQMGDANGIGTAAYHLGQLRYEQGDGEGARECFETAIESLRGGVNRAFAAQSATYLGQIQMTAGENETACETLAEALELYEEHTFDPALRLTALFSLAQAYALTDHGVESLEHARTGLKAAFLLHPRTAGMAVPHILKLTGTYVEREELLGPFVRDVRGLVGRLQEAKPRENLRQEWRLACQLLDRVATLLARVGTAYGPDGASQAERDQAKADLPGAARALDEVTGGILGVAAWAERLGSV
jgi:tetratricopeptide (TPR) repeat protein